MSQIIAEIGQNHNGDMDLACLLIKSAKDNGADVAKFQLYDAKALFPRKNNPWYEYNCKTELTRKQVKVLFEECKKQDIEFMASVFDSQRISWLEQLGVKRYKVASRSIHDQELIRKLCLTAKPLIVSLGMWGGKHFPVFRTKAKVDYLYCISKYPTALKDVHLAQVDFHNVYSGFSDHTLGLSCAMCAFSRGARIIEKHFTLDKSSYGPDHAGSMTPQELKQLDGFRKDTQALLR